MPLSLVSSSVPAASVQLHIASNAKAFLIEYGWLGYPRRKICVLHWTRITGCNYQRRATTRPPAMNPIWALMWSLYFRPPIFILSTYTLSSCLLHLFLQYDTFKHRIFRVYRCLTLLDACSSVAPTALLLQPKSNCLPLQSNRQAISKPCIPDSRP